MVKPFVTFADPEAVVHAYLLAEFAGRVEAYIPETVTNRFPAEIVNGDVREIKLAGDQTHVQVELDGSDVADFPVTDRATVRVTCYSAERQPSNAKDLASLSLGILGAFPGSASAHGIVPLTGRIKAQDPTTRNQMVSFTVRVDLVATQLAS